MKKPFILLCFSLAATIVFAQNIISKKESVNINAPVSTAEAAKDLPEFATTEDAEKIISRIMNVVGLETNFKIKKANVANVEANVRHKQRYILYNPDFISQVNEVARDKWVSIFILAHEVGHHLNGHTVSGVNSRPPIELEADEFAGFILCKMGASLEQAQHAMYIFANVSGSKTHPSRLERLTSIAKGWNKAEGQMKQMALQYSDTEISGGN
jgi:hypothetical protein